jgi:hypothetical protein
MSSVCERRIGVDHKLLLANLQSEQLSVTKITVAGYKVATGIGVKEVHYVPSFVPESSVRQ